MKIALLGFGRMGKAIEEIAIARGHTIVFKQDKETFEGDLKKATIAINFSTPDTAVMLIKTALQLGIPVVSGTTGWQDEYDTVTAFCKSQKSAFLYASNFSVGVNLFFKLNKMLASLMQQQTEYTTKIEETHHIHKVDAPSGTAITLAEGIVKHTDYKAWSLTPDNNKTLPIKAIREGEVPGLHRVDYESEFDSISILHNANSRKGFALGALIAGEWLEGKEGIFSMDDVLKLS